MLLAPAAPLSMSRLLQVTARQLASMVLRLPPDLISRCEAFCGPLSSPVALATSWAGNPDMLGFCASGLSSLQGPTWKVCFSS